MRHVEKKKKLKKKGDVAGKHINWELNMLSALEN